MSVCVQFTINEYFHIVIIKSRCSKGRHKRYKGDILVILLIHNKHIYNWQGVSLLTREIKHKIKFINKQNNHNKVINY